MEVRILFHLFRDTYVGDIQLGSFQKVKIPDRDQLANLYQNRSVDNTFRKIRIADDDR